MKFDEKFTGKYDLINKVRRKSLPLALAATLVPVLIFGGGGYLLDSLLDKKPLFLIIGLVVSFVLTNIIIVFFGKRIWKR